MTRGQQIVWAVVIVVVLGGLYWWWSTSQQGMSGNNTAATMSDQDSDTYNAATTTANSTPTGTNTAASSTADTSAPMEATVSYNGSSFSPASVTIAQGGTITFTDTNGMMWVASDPHPVHNGYDGTTRQQHCASGYTGAAPFDQCAPGASFTFTFNKVGTWGYHNHLSAEDKGSVTVVAAQ